EDAASWAAVVFSTEIELRWRDRCTQLAEALGIDAGVIFEDSLVRIGQHDDLAVSRQLLHQVPLRIVGVLKLIEDDHWVPVSEQFPNAGRSRQKSGCAPREQVEGVNGTFVGEP